jgi:hypothetical protein
MAEAREGCDKAGATSIAGAYPLTSYVDGRASIRRQAGAAHGRALCKGVGFLFFVENAGSRCEVDVIAPCLGKSDSFLLAQPKTVSGWQAGRRYNVRPRGNYLRFLEFL